MKTLSFFLLSIICFSLSSFAQTTRITLDEALQKKLIQLVPQGLGGYQGKCLEIMIKNISPDVLSLEIPAGQMFTSEDTSIQNLVITKSQTLALAPSTNIKKQLFTMCTQAGNMGPGKGERFSLGKMATPSLYRLVQRIDAGSYQNSTAQSAVWSITNKESINQVFGEDQEMVRDLAEIVSEERNIPIEQFDLSPRRHQLSSIKTSLETRLDHDLTNAQLVLVDEQGSVLRKYFEHRFYEQGFHQWKVGASHTRGDSAVLFLRLLDGDEFVSEKKVSVLLAKTDSITTMKDFHSQSIMNYEVNRDLTADIGVYDKENKLYFLIKKEHLIKKGFHRGQYIAKCQLPPGQDYFIKVLAGDEVIASEKIEETGIKPKLFPKAKIRGVFKVKLKEEVNKGDLAIYDKEGKLVRKLFHVNHLNPGTRQFTYFFEHRAGPEAVFYVRLSDEKEEVIAEQKIRKR